MAQNIFIVSEKGFSLECLETETIIVCSYTQFAVLQKMRRVDRSIKVLLAFDFVGKTTLLLAESLKLPIFSCLSQSNQLSKVVDDLLGIEYSSCWLLSLLNSTGIHQIIIFNMLSGICR